MALGRHTLSIETGQMAKQADGAVVVRLGDTVVLATACAQREPRVGVDFLPLTVDYRENNYAAGKIPGGFFKREGRPNEKEILTSRMIDRPLRPLFPEGYACETQVIGLLLSADMENDSDTLSIIGASTALVHLRHPVRHAGGRGAGRATGTAQFVVNPTSADLKAKSQLNLLVAGTEDAIVMVEAGAQEVSGGRDGAGPRRGPRRHQADRRASRRSSARGWASRSAPFAKKELDPSVVAEIEGALAEPLLAADADQGQARVLRPDEEGEGRVPGVHPRGPAGEEGRVRRRLRRPAREAAASARSSGTAAGSTAAASTRSGRSPARSASCPRTHGSALFTRGETQALVTATLGTSEDSQIIDTVQEAEYRKRFMLHYNFPPFSVGEVKFLRGPGRREIGHGALAERALREMLPAEEAFPYTIRIVSDILESNGSSSMATICGGTLALMDAGVPIKSPVAGVAMGLVKDGDRAPGPHRHRRRGRPLRRHGLQGRRHPRRHHRPADGHQDRRHHRRDHGAGARAGPGGPPPHPRPDGRGPRPAARRHQPLRAAHPHHPRPGGQDPRHHRAGRQDDPLDRGADGLQDRRRGRRPRVDRLGGRVRGPQGRSPSSRS